MKNKGGIGLIGVKYVPFVTYVLNVFSAANTYAGVIPIRLRARKILVEPISTAFVCVRDQHGTKQFCYPLLASFKRVSPLPCPAKWSSFLSLRLPGVKSSQKMDQRIHIRVEVDPCILLPLCYKL